MEKANVNQDANICILSVGDAHRKAPQYITKDEDRIVLKKIVETVVSDATIVGDNNDYHNLAATYAQLDDYISAFDIVDKGLRQFPYDVDLLADAVRYGSKCGKIRESKPHLATLLSRPLEYWNWRTFTFVIDFYLLSITWEDPETIEITFQEALKIAKEYQKLNPTEERGFEAEAEIYLASSDSEKALDTLKKAIYDLTPMLTPQCCIKYAEILANRGDFENVIEVCNRGILSTAQEQPTARTGYFFYLSALAKDALIHRTGNFTEEKDILEVYTDYKVAYKLLKSTPTYINNIRVRVEILAAKSGIPFDFDTNEKLERLANLFSTDENELA